MARRRSGIGWIGALALAVIWFLVFDNGVSGYTRPFLAVVAVGCSLVSVWALNIASDVVDYYRERRETDYLRRVAVNKVDEWTPAAPRVMQIAALFGAAVLVVSATVGSGVAPIDRSTPSYNVTAPDVAAAQQQPSNTASVGGSFGDIKINEDRTITVFVEDTSTVDGVVVVGPDEYQIASGRIGTGTRRVDMQPTRPLTNGTYEVIGVALDVNQQNILLSESEEVESHQVKLNVTAG